MPEARPSGTLWRRKKGKCLLHGRWIRRGSGIFFKRRYYTSVGHHLNFQKHKACTRRTTLEDSTPVESRYVVLVANENCCMGLLVLALWQPRIAGAVVRVHLLHIRICPQAPHILTWKFPCSTHNDRCSSENVRRSRGNGQEYITPWTDN